MGPTPQHHLFGLTEMTKSNSVLFGNDGAECQMGEASALIRNV